MNYRRTFWKWVILAAVIIALAYVFVMKAHADDWPLLVTQTNGQGGFYFPTGPAVITDADGIEFALVSGDTPLNIGLPARPWRNLYVQNKVSAGSFVAAGAPGINTVIHFGQCVLTIQGGLITSAVVPPGNQPCP